MTNTDIIELTERALRRVKTPTNDNIVDIVDVDYWLFDDVIGEHEVPVSGFIRISEFIEGLKEDLSADNTPLIRQLRYSVEADNSDYYNAQYIIADTPALFDMKAKGIYLAI